MKTLQLVPAMEQGGVERGVVEVNRVLVGAGWENVVVSSGGRLTEKIIADGGRSVVLDVKSKNPLTFFSRARRLRKLLIAEKPDVVCAHSRVPAWLFVWANRTLGIPWITFAHGANSVSAYSKVMTFGDLTVTPSRFIADHLKSNYALVEERIRVIQRAIDHERFDPTRLDGDFIAAKRREWGTDGHFIVMALGRITHLKGFDVLIREVAKLPERFKLVIVGEAEALRKDVEEGLRNLVVSLGMEKRVVFAGNQQKVAECLSIADVVVSSNTKKPEAFGRSMAEALAMGRPVVAKAFGGALDVVRDGIDGVLTKDAEFAAAIERVAGMRFGDLRKDALERFSFEAMAGRTLNVYREVLALKGGVPGGVGMERWLELLRMVSAGGLELLGSGKRRVAYGIPGTGLCFKSYVQNSPNPVIAREISAFRFNGERNTCAQEGRYFRDIVKRLPVDLAAVFPETLELVVLPGHGWSLVEERIVNADGSALERFLPTYRDVSPDVRPRLLAEFLKLMKGLSDHAVRFYDLQNVLVQWLGERNTGAFRLRIVDFEPAARTFIPLDSLCKALVRAKVRRRARRFLKLRLGIKRPEI